MANADEGAPAVRKRRARRLTSAQRRVLTLIRTCSHGGGVTTLTKQYIADLLSVNVKTVDRAIARLRDEGYIEVVPRYGDDGAQLANGYRAVRRE